MLAIVGLLTILVVMFLIMTKKCSTLVALIAVPMIACVIVGQGADMGGYQKCGRHRSHVYFCSGLFRCHG